MSFQFGARSESRINECDERLQRVMRRAIRTAPLDFTIVCGHRTRDEQERAYRSGMSKAQWPNSKHNSIPSVAVDFAPWTRAGIPWGDLLAFARVAGVIEAAAAEEGVAIRWGGDWDRDGSSTDNPFMDAGHIELVT